VSKLVSKGVRPGRTLSIKDLTFDGFPGDGGLWWLRWMDCGVVTTTSRSFVTMLATGFGQWMVSGWPMTSSMLQSRTAKGGGPARGRFRRPHGGRARSSRHAGRA